VVKVLTVTAGKTVDFATLRPQLEAEARARAAERKISEAADAFEKAYAGGANMTEAAKSVGLTAITTAPVTAQGAALDGKPATGLSPKLLDTAFKLPEGGDSEVTEDERGEYFIVRVEKVTPPALPPIDEVRGPLTAAYIEQETQTLLKAKADELAARIRKGEGVEAVAASIGATAAPLTGLSQYSASEQAAKLGAPMIRAALNAKAGDVVVAQGGSGLVVIKVDAVKNGDSTQMAAVVDQARAQIGNQVLDEYRNQIGVAATGAVKLQVYPDRAKSALGIEPVAPSKGKAG
jgi:peptidyl-prolyl cis-trans isomerase D